MFLFQVKLYDSQVSHHPPAAAHHVISDRGWTLRQEITVASKFRGKYLSIMPLGKSQIAKILSMLFWQWLGCHITAAVHTCWRTSLVGDLSVMLEEWTWQDESLNQYGWLSKRQWFAFVDYLSFSFLSGTIHAIFEKGNNHYTWKKVTTTVHNIIVGKLWIDQVRPADLKQDDIFKDQPG